jgi:hypothetical protein
MVWRLFLRFRRQGALFLPSIARHRAKEVESTGTGYVYPGMRYWSIISKGMNLLALWAICRKT